jgi:hypothetical protein
VFAAGTAFVPVDIEYPAIPASRHSFHQEIELYAIEGSEAIRVDNLGYITPACHQDVLSRALLGPQGPGQGYQYQQD